MKKQFIRILTTNERQFLFVATDTACKFRFGYAVVDGSPVAPVLAVRSRNTLHVYSVGCEVQFSQGVNDYDEVTPVFEEAEEWQSTDTVISLPATFCQRLHVGGLKFGATVLVTVHKPLTDED